MDHATVSISAATSDDLDAIGRIYDHYVRQTAITFDVEAPTRAWRADWFERYRPSGPHRLLVAREDDVVVGYTTSSPYRDRAAYASSVETSVYVDPVRVGRGIGHALYTELLAALAAEPVHRAFAGIALPNPASVRLHERHGFRQVGVFTEQGYKLGHYRDVAWFERPLP
jgi:phosphinothricin acetyltransferase